MVLPNKPSSTDNAATATAPAPSPWSSTPDPAENRLLLAQVAKGLYLRAEAEENRIAIKFDGWLPAEKPTDAFTKKWTGLIDTASGNVT